MRINHNIVALKANTTLGRTNKSMDKSLERLSSGYRINKAADDAAGMAISRKMKTQIAALNQASRNAADGVSVIQTAEGALNEVHAMLQRMRELSVQASSGTMTDTDRQTIQDEINQLNQEINRISETTEFNTKSLLDGSIDRKSFSDDRNIQLVALSDEVAVKDYTVTVTSNPKKAEITETKPAGVTPAVAPSGTLNINGVDIAIKSTDSYEDMFESIRNACETMNISVKAVDAAGDEVRFGAGAKLQFSSFEYGSKQSIEIKSDSEEVLSYLGLDEVDNMVVKGEDAEVSLGTEFATTATASVSGNQVTITDSSGFKMKLKLSGQTVPEGEASATVTISVLDAGPMTLQVGANANQTMELRIPKIDSETLGIATLNAGTQVGAEEAITLVDEATSEVSRIRSKLGAYQNRLEHTITNVEDATLNMDEALSRIEDADMAEEMTKYTQYSVLSQAGTSMLAQANERPQTILTLLQG